MPDIRKRTVYRHRLSSAAQTPKSPAFWRGFLCPILRCNRWSRKPLRPGSVEPSMPAAVAATGSSGCSTPTAKTTSFKSRAHFTDAACSRTFRRQGLEAGANYQTGQYLVYANYAFIDATYQFSGTLASPNNPFADENGNIFVTPGKQIPGIPRHQVKGGVDYWITPELKLGTDVIWVSSQWFIGDDANQNPKLADYWVANVHGSYQLTKDVQIYGFINNLFNRKFATVGTFFDTQSTVAVAIPNVLNDPRMVTPAQPLSVYLGMRAKL